MEKSSRFKARDKPFALGTEANAHVFRKYAYEKRKERGEICEKRSRGIATRVVTFRSAERRNMEEFFLDKARSKSGGARRAFLKELSTWVSAHRLPFIVREKLPFRR